MTNHLISGLLRWKDINRITRIIDMLTAAQAINNPEQL